MQLRQKYTINNVTYENEMFISEKDNVNIIGAIEYFFNIPNTDKKVEVVSIREKDEQTAKTEEKSATNENNNTVVTVPVEHEEKEADVNIKGTSAETTHGYYVKFLLDNKLIKKWASWKTEKKAKDSIYNLAYRQRKEKGYNIKCEILEIQPMTLEEFNKIN